MAVQADWWLRILIYPSELNLFNLFTKKIHSLINTANLSAGSFKGYAKTLICSVKELYSFSMFNQ